jgi:transcriptional regulator with XRE-family HTH domain
MPSNSNYIEELLRQLKAFRIDSGKTEESVEKELILGPGWVSQFENGAFHPSLDMIVALLSVYGKTIQDLPANNSQNVPQINRTIGASQDGQDLVINFDYTRYQAKYRLHGATSDEFDDVLLCLRNGLARLSANNAGEDESNVKSDSVAQTFLKAVKIWPHANPSDVWWFVVYRAYCDPYNHPAEFARLNLTESWKRTSGWALERAFVEHYAPALADEGIHMFIASSEDRVRLIRGLEVGHRLEADKMDIMLTVDTDDGDAFIGVVHVKASFAERRTDDVPMSGALVNAGYLSPLLTMDCKSVPSANPSNKGELGNVYMGSGDDKRSAKRVDMEDDGFFSACFSYNKNTKPTPPQYNSPGGRVVLCDFTSPRDSFHDFIVSETAKIRTALGI